MEDMKMNQSQKVKLAKSSNLPVLQDLVKVLTSETEMLRRMNNSKEWIRR